METVAKLFCESIQLIVENYTVNLTDGINVILELIISKPSADRIMISVRIFLFIFFPHLIISINYNIYETQTPNRNYLSLTITNVIFLTVSLEVLRLNKY